MNPEEILRRKIGGTLRSLALVATLLGLLVIPAWMLGGAFLGLVALTALLGGLLLVPRASPALVARFFRAREIRRDEAPGMLAAAEALARRAHLDRVPRLYFTNSPAPQAFTTGDRENAAIILSAGLLRRLAPLEITGVLAHEMSHVRSQDTSLMLFAGLAGRITGTLASLAIVLIWISLPLALLGWIVVDPLALLVLVVAPHVSTMAALSLSRTREFEADLEAARLVGSPEPLASALVKIEAGSRGLLGRIFWPTGNVPPLLSSHPATSERVRRLLSLRRPPTPLARGA